MSTNLKKLKIKKTPEIKIKTNPENNIKNNNSQSNLQNNIQNNLQINEWVLPNKKEFPDWINQTFIKYKSDGKPQKSIPGKYKPFKYQLFLKKYMSNDSPYRGVLLYMGTGSGKTCTSIEIAENLKTERNIVVMLPASLRTNFIVNGLLFCGSNEYKENPEKIKEKYSFISYNANNTLAQIKKIGSLDNKVIIIDEVHNLVSKMMSGLILNKV